MKDDTNREKNTAVDNQGKVPGKGHAFLVFGIFLFIYSIFSSGANVTNLAMVCFLLSPVMVLIFVVMQVRYWIYRFRHRGNTDDEVLQEQEEPTPVSVEAAEETSQTPSHQEQAFKSEHEPVTVTPEAVQESGTGKVQWMRIPTGNSGVVERLMQRFIAVDVETTGLDRERDRIIQIAAVVFESGVPTEQWSTFVNPGRHIPAEATRINNITDSMVRQAPSQQEAARLFLGFIGDAAKKGTILCAHNAEFDMAFIGETLKGASLDGDFFVVDTLSLARKYVYDVQNYKLTTLARKLRISVDDAHRADADAVMCGKLLVRLLSPMQMEVALKGNENNQPTEDEMRVCSYLVECFRNAGIGPERILFEKRSGKIKVKSPYKFASFKVLKSGKFYFIFDREIDCGLETKALSDGTHKVTANRLEDIEVMMPALQADYTRMAEKAGPFYVHIDWVSTAAMYSFVAEPLVQNQHS